MFRHADVSSCVIVRAGGAIWLKPFCYGVIYCHCRVFVFSTRVAWVCLVCLLLGKEDGSSPVSLQLVRGGIWACMRCPCLCRVLVYGLC